MTMKRKTGVLLADNRDNGIIAEGISALKKAGFEKEECAVFADSEK